MKELKKYYRFILVAIVALGITQGLSGCDTFLEKNTEGILSPNSFYKSPEDLEAGVAAAWSPVITGGYTSFGSPHLFNPLMGGDDWTTEPARVEPAGIDQFRASPTDKFLGANWTTSYQAIYRANTLLTSLNESPVRQEVKDRVAAQVRFLRGWLYFRLVRLFGPVPLHLTPEGDTGAPQIPVDEVYEQIISDLTFAEEHLPENWFGAPGKPTMWAAKGLLARIYLTMAGWPLYEEGNYALAQDKFREVMAEGPFRLLEDFSSLWQIENNWNDEFVFALPFCQECGNMGNAITGTTTAPLEEGGTGAGFAEIQFFNDYPEDTRKDATFYTTFEDGTSWQEGALGHPLFAKWRSGTSLEGDGPEPTMSSRSLPLIRYAHVLLGFAEAQAMADGAPSTAAYDAVNQVRNRAGLPNLTSGLGQEAFRDSVIKERGWEFAGEFTRWHDLVRTEKVAEANANKAEEDMQPLRDIQSLLVEHYYWMPIPKSELDLNENLTQNTGY